MSFVFHVMKSSTFVKKQPIFFIIDFVSTYNLFQNQKSTNTAFYADNPTRKFLTNQIAAFFKFGPIKLIYSDNLIHTLKSNGVFVIMTAKNVCPNFSSDKTEPNF
jgi:hypothetical protein